MGIGPELALRKRFAFESPSPCGIVENDRVRGICLTPLTRDVRASLVFLHGWKTSRLAPLARRMRELVDSGVEVFFPALPFHLWRRVGMTFSGAYFLTPDLDRSLLAMQQAVRDVRALLTWIRRRQLGPTTLVGADVGATVACLTATVQEGLAGLVAIACPEKLGDLVWSGRSDRGKMREALEAAGITREMLDLGWSVLDPHWRAPLVQPAKVLVAAGRQDDICGPRTGARLLESWGGGRLGTFDFAHSSYHFCLGEILQETLALASLKEEDSEDGSRLRT